MGPIGVSSLPVAEFDPVNRKKKIILLTESQLRGSCTRETPSFKALVTIQWR